MILGIWVIILPFLGFPSSWDQVLAIVSGLLICGIAYSLGPKPKSGLPPSIPFVEHRSAAPTGAIGRDVITNPNPDDKK